MKENTLDDIINYIKLSKLTKIEKQRCIDVINSDFKNIDGDYKKYCNEVINKVTEDNSRINYYIEKAIEFLNYTSLIFLSYYFIQSFMLIKNNKSISLDIQISLGILLLILSIIVMMYIATYSINKESKKRCFDINKNFIKNQGAIVLTICALVLYTIINIIIKIIPNKIINIPIYIIIGLLLITYLINNLILNKK